MNNELLNQHHFLSLRKSGGAKLIQIHSTRQCCGIETCAVTPRLLISVHQSRHLLTQRIINHQLNMSIGGKCVLKGIKSLIGHS